MVQAVSAADSNGTLLLGQPTLSRDHLAFVRSGDIWVTDRAGHQPVRLTTHGTAEAPHFSPDGSWIAFSGTYEGNTDVYVIPTAGGQPQRLTYHPGRDVVNGWSADGKQILFASPREVANSRSNQLYEIPVTGGFEQKVMEAVAFEGTWSPDGTRLAYRPYRKANDETAGLLFGWRRYRGGETTPLWILDPKTQAMEKVPHVNASDSNPVWVGGELIFISDRSDKAANIFAYDLQTRALRQLSHETDWDVRNLAAYDHTVVYEAGGRLTEVDIGSASMKPLTISITADDPQARTQWKAASGMITSAHLSPTGKRVLVSARGDIFTVPVRDGSTRDITGTSGIREKDAVWSPDGARIAYISETGDPPQHELVIRDQQGLTAPRIYPLSKTGYFNLIAWSPDGKTLAISDNHWNLYLFSLEKGSLTKVDTSLRRIDFATSFSPDGHWLAYTVTGSNNFSQIRIYDITTGKATPVTDGLAEAGSPAFGPGGLLYFTASINAGLTHETLDLFTQERPVHRGIFVAVLAADGKSPLLPRAGDEDVKFAERSARVSDKSARVPDKAAANSEATPTKPDFDDIQHRIVGLPIPERFYDHLAVASDGALFYVEQNQLGASVDPPGTGVEGELYRFDFKEKKAVSVKKGLVDFEISADGRKLLLRSALGALAVGDANEKVDAVPIDVSQLGMLVDPRQEWRQIFNEAWWLTKEYFYDPKLHGIDWDAVRTRYLPLLAHVQRREDLNALLASLESEMQVGHAIVAGGDVLHERPDNVGLLGADFSLENGHYRFKTVYAGDSWNPYLKAPLAAFGAGVHAGEYLLAVNGHPVDYAHNLYASLENTVGRQATLTVGADPAGGGARQVVVEPVASEAELRQWQWVEHNRQYVADKSGGKLAYVYLPSTGAEGFQYFNRMYFPQNDKRGLIIDERRNNGGGIADYILDVLSRKYLAGWVERDGQLYSSPADTIFGPKVMLIDQDAGSGGDFLPYGFKYLGIGTLVGTRTWGCLIGLEGAPRLIDGGAYTVPNNRFLDPHGEWHIENEGVTPDVVVELDPAEVNRGRDTQLDAAIATAMKQLETYEKVDQRTAPPRPTPLAK